MPSYGVLTRPQVLPNQGRPSACPVRARRSPAKASAYRFDARLRDEAAFHSAYWLNMDRDCIPQRPATRVMINSPSI